MKLIRANFSGQNDGYLRLSHITFIFSKTTTDGKCMVSAGPMGPFLLDIGVDDLRNLIESDECE